MTVSTVLAILVFWIAVPLNWYVTWTLVRLARAAPDLLVLRDRAIAAGALTVLVTVFALIFANNELETPILDGEATRIITRLVVLGMTVPALYWLRLYRAGDRE